jgi:AcrR family transcriptional regulator
MTDMKTTRTYTMGARAQAVEENRRRIVESLVRLAGERPFSDISLEDIASTAGVSVQTVLRQYGSREGLFTQAMEQATDDVVESRRTPPGDVDAAVRTVVQHYEDRGRTALLMLGQESYDDTARRATDLGKQMHRDWVREAFAPATDDVAVLDLLVVATDVYTWKLLRLDRGLSRTTTQKRMLHLVTAVLAGATHCRGPPWPRSSSSPGTAAATCRPSPASPASSSRAVTACASPATRSSATPSPRQGSTWCCRRTRATSPARRRARRSR